LWSGVVLTLWTGRDDGRDSWRTEGRKEEKVRAALRMDIERLFVSRLLLRHHLGRIFAFRNRSYRKRGNADVRYELAVTKRATQKRGTCGYETVMKGMNSRLRNGRHKKRNLRLRNGYEIYELAVTKRATKKKEEDTGRQTTHLSRNQWRGRGCPRYRRRLPSHQPARTQPNAKGEFCCWCELVSTTTTNHNKSVAIPASGVLRLPWALGPG
jgi:hypothetical protein